MNTSTGMLFAVLMLLAHDGAFGHGATLQASDSAAAVSPELQTASSDHPGCVVRPGSRGLHDDYFSPEGGGPLFRVVLDEKSRPVDAIPMRDELNKLGQRNAARAVLKWEYDCPPGVAISARWARAYAPVFHVENVSINEPDGALNLAESALTRLLSSHRFLIDESRFRVVAAADDGGETHLCGEVRHARMPVSYEELSTLGSKRFIVPVVGSEPSGFPFLESVSKDLTTFEAEWSQRCAIEPGLVQNDGAGKTVLSGVLLKSLAANLR